MTGEPESTAAGRQVEHLFVRASDTIRRAMEAISDSTLKGLPSGLALVVSPDLRLEGVVTDGDVRRALLRGESLDGPVADIMTPDPIVFDSSMTYRDIMEAIPRRISQKGRYRGGVLERVVIADPDGRVTEVLQFMELWRRQNLRHHHVCISGMGFVGLTLAVTLAEAGVRVTGVEPVAEIRDSILRGVPHFHEVGLEALLNHHLGGRLAVEAAVVDDAEVYIIAVGTPVSPNGEPDSTQIKSAAREIGAVLKQGDLVLLRSTVAVGTCRTEILPVLESTSGLRCGRDFHLAFAPERTVEGKALKELRTLPQVVGGFDRNSTDLAANLFRVITPSIVAVDSLEEAEMVKLVNNSFRDLSFAFANEFAMACEPLNLDAGEIIRTANEGYPRNRIPEPSPGVGGLCLKKDPYLYAHVVRRSGIEAPLSQLGREINERMPALVASKVKTALLDHGKTLSDSTVFVVGFAFKGEPETSDVRNSTTLDIVELLRAEVGEIRGYDPVVEEAALRELGVVPFELTEGFEGADCVVIANNHRSYADLDIYARLESMARPAVYCDCWRVFSPSDIAQVQGVTYLGLGFSS